MEVFFSVRDYKLIMNILNGLKLVSEKQLENANAKAPATPQAQLPPASPVVPYVEPSEVEIASEQVYFHLFIVNVLINHCTASTCLC